MTTIERLEAVLKETGNSYSSLAAEILLPQKQSLYDIKNGRVKSISFVIATKIHLRYPQYSIEWLTGQSDVNVVTDPNEGALRVKVAEQYINKMEDYISQLKERIADKDEIIKTKDMLIEQLLGGGTAHRKKPEATTPTPNLELIS